MKFFNGFFDGFFSHFTEDLGIDLGTSNTLVYSETRGVLLNEPSVVAVDTETNTILQVGEEAQRMLGRTPSTIAAIRPLRDGVIADYDQTQAMLRYFISKTTTRRFAFRKVVVGIPSGVTEVERRAVIEACRRSGASQAFVIEEPMAAAIGAGLPVAEPTGSMVVDIGGGTTEVAIISLAGIVSARSIRIAGDEIDEAIVNYVRRAFNLYIGERTAERAKIEIGCAYPLEEQRTFELRGRDLISGLPRSAVITSEDIRIAIQEQLNAIVEAVKLTLESAPPELAADIIHRGIVLAGGGALLRGLDRLIAEETGIPVVVAHDPLSCVVIGTGKVLSEVRRNPQLGKVLVQAYKD
ncbi:MAG TPA: rod shape-determining protein [Fimbriimonadales bacterium]|nr:rod shape-determining protein [Fimbriimonadales bacterium]